MRLLLSLLLFVLGGFYLSLISCKDTASSDTASAISQKDDDSTADRIIRRAIEAHGGEHYENIDLSFSFRKHTYKANREEGVYTYERFGTDSLGRETHDILNNEGIIRRVDGKESTLTPKQELAYAESVNSVIYFVLLPYFLLDPAVNSKYLGTVAIHGETYEKILVTFREKGGGVDFEDEYLYWFHQEKSTVDYLAYNYKTDGGGARFREAYNPRTINGIRFLDYRNFKPDPETRYINNFDTLFQEGKLKQISRIETEDISVH